MITDEVTLRKAIKKVVKKNKAKKRRLDNFDRTEFAKQVRGKPFWIEDETEHQRQTIATSEKCCFWHIIGLPEKEHLMGKGEDGKEIKETKKHPIYDYEMEVYNTILTNRYVRIKKATGIGITTFVIGLMIYLCVKDSEYKDAEMGIVTGPRLEVASYVQSRLVGLLANTEYRPKRVGDSVWINGCKITAYPSHTFDTARGLDKCRFFFVDEADFFPHTQIEPVMTVLERYEAKTHPHVVLNSTVNQPDGLYAMMDAGKYPQFKTIEVFYQRGVGKIYTEYEIEQAKKSSSFAHEYDGQYQQSEGNIFSHDLLNKCILTYDIAGYGNGGIIAVDPGYGTSKFAIVAGKKNGDDILITEAREYDRPSVSEMVEVIVKMAPNYERVVVDDTNPGLIQDLINRGLTVFKGSFRRDLSKMIMTASDHVEKRTVIIHPQFTNLISQLRMVRFNEHGHPDKKPLSFDLGDAFLLLLHKFKAADWYWVRLSM